MGIFDNNAVVRWTVRKGTETQRISYNGFLQGELVYTTDGKRLFVGTGNGGQCIPVGANLCATGSAMLHPGDFCIDSAKNTVTFKTETGDFTLAASAAPDGDTIVYNGGRLTARKIPVDSKWFTIGSNGLSLNPSIEVSEITVPRNSTLKVPGTVDFGGVSIAFSASSIENAPLTLGLRRDGEGKYSAFIVNMPQGGGGGGEGTHYSFSTNFKTVASTGLVQVDLSADLSGVASIGAPDGTRLDLTGLRGGLSADYGLGVHVNEDNSLTVVRTENGGGASGGGAVELLDNPPFICWNGNTKGNPDIILSANMEFTTQPYLFCNRKRMFISGRIPALDEGESFESDTYVAKLESETGTRAYAYDFWNNSIQVLGRNNYANLVNGQRATVEDEEGTIRQKCFMELNGGVLSTQFFEQEEIPDGAAGSEAAVPAYAAPLEILRTSNRGGRSKVYARRRAGDYSEVSGSLDSVSVDGEPLSIPELTAPDGVVSLDSANASCAGGWKVLYNNPAVEIDLHESLMPEKLAKRSLQITIPKGAKAYRYESASGKIFHMQAGTVQASTLTPGDIVVARAAGGSPVFKEVSSTRAFSLASTGTAKETHDLNDALTYDIVSYKDAFTVDGGKVKPRDLVNPPVDADDRFIQPLSWTLEKTVGGSTTAVGNPIVNTTVPATAPGAVIVASDISVLEELGYTKGAEPGEYWEETVQLDGSPASRVKLYNSAMGRPAYADSIEKLHFMKNPTSVLRKSAVAGAYEVLYDAAHGNRKLSLNTAALQYTGGGLSSGMELCVLAFVPLKEGERVIDPERISEATLERAEGTAPVLLGYDFTMENANGGTVIELEKGNIFADVFSTSAQLSIGDGPSPLPGFLGGDVVCVRSLEQAEYAGAASNIERVYLKRCEDGQYPYRLEDGDTRFTLKASKTGEVVDSTSGYRVSQYQVSEGRFLEDETVTEPGKLTGVKVSSTIKSATLDETVPAEARTGIPAGVQSVFVEVTHNLAATSLNYTQAVLYADSFKGLATFDPVDFGNTSSSWNWYDLAPEGTTPYYKSGSSSTSYSYKAPQAYVKDDASTSKERPLAPQGGETLGCHGYAKYTQVLEVPVVDNRFFLRVAGQFRSSKYGEFAVRLVGYRKK